MPHCSTNKKKSVRGSFEWWAATCVKRKRFLLLGFPLKGREKRGLREEREVGKHRVARVAGQDGARAEVEPFVGSFVR